MRDVFADLERLERLAARFRGSYEGFPPIEQAAHELAYNEALRLELAIARFRAAAARTGPAERLAECVAEEGDA